MQYLHVKKLFVRTSLFVFIAVTAFTTSSKAGLDYYSIYLGKKLIYERYVNKPLDLQSLPINAANANETLTIYYSQCNAPGKTGTKRTIALKDDKGNTVKQWSFANAQGDNTGMAIQVNELLQLQKKNKNGALALFYTAEGRTEGMKLASIQTASKDITYSHQQGDNLVLQATWLMFTLLFRNAVAV